MFAIRVFVTVLLIVWAVDLIRQSLDVEALRIGISAAGTYPIWILVITAVLMGLHLAFNLLPAARRGTDTLGERLPETTEDRWRLVVFIGLWVGYVALMPVLGFLVVTSLITACSVLLLDRNRRWWVVVPSAVVFSLTMEIVFRTVFYVLLPASFVDEWVDSVLYRL